MRSLSLILLAGLTAASCAKPEPELIEDEPTAAVGDEEPEEVSIEGVAWSDMNHEQQEKYMAEVVQPTMKELFAAFDPEEAEGFGCATCHGENAEEVGFEMPNTLHPLDPEAMPTPASPDPEEAKWANFMFTKVTPTMADLLGAEPYDMETGEGFGCFGCHAQKN